MERRTTQGTSRTSMILLATVVFPEALPPHRPTQPTKVHVFNAASMVLEWHYIGNNGIHDPHTDDKGLFGLGAVLIIPGGSASGVDGACAGAEQGRLSLTQGHALPAGGGDGGQEPVQRVLPTSTGTHSKGRSQQVEALHHTELWARIECRQGGGGGQRAD